MIASRFRSVWMVAGVAAAALGCYLVSLRVASERGELERLEARISSTRSDIRQLETELGTRGRLVQLERWNAEVLALQAPKAQQYLTGEVQLAGFGHQPAPVLDAPDSPVRLAAAAPPPAPKPLAEPVRPVAAAPEPEPQSDPGPLLRHATYEKPARSAAPVARKVGLLDDALLADIGRAAAREAQPKKRP